MIILKDECKSRGLTVGQFIKDCPVPAQTLRDWCKTKPDLVLYLLRVPEQAEKIELLNVDLERYGSLKTAILNLQNNNDFLNNKIAMLKKEISLLSK